MNYPLGLLNIKLQEAINAQAHCIKCYNKEDYLKIQNEIIIPIKTTIKLIEMAIGNELKFNSIKDV